MNSFGQRFRFTTFGESHGKAIGCIVDGVPAGLDIDIDFIQSELDRRRPGQNAMVTGRKEADKVEILSGVFEGKSTGTPISMIIFNSNQKSRDYDNVKDIFRPGHADFTYWNKYGIRDYRGGGRSSARETALRVAVGALAKLMLKEVGIKIEAGIFEIDGIRANEDNFDFEYAKKSEINALDSTIESKQKEAVIKAKESHDSVGGAVVCRATGVPIGLGEPIYYKLDSILANAMMSINAAKAVEIGDGIASCRVKGSQNNDGITPDGFLSNHSGGILGGISNGDTVIVKTYFKPTPSIFKEQSSINIHGESIKYKLKGRHDPCVAIRGSIVCEAMMAIVLADMLMLNMGSKMEYIKKIYN